MRNTKTVYKSTFSLFLAILFLSFVLIACEDEQRVDPIEQTTIETPMDEINYENPLPEGMSALRKVPEAQWPDIQNAITNSDPNMIIALNHSIGWFEKPSSKQFFPMDGITHAQAKQSVLAFRSLLLTRDMPSNKMRRFRDMFNVYMSVGYNLQGTVLFTGYYSPIFKASKTPQGEYQYPLYTAPEDLKRDPKTGQVIGDYPSRQELENSGKLQGLELVYLPSAMDAYIIHVNGAAKLEMIDGSTMHIGFAGHNGHDYVSLRKELLDDGKIGKRDGLPAILEYFRINPQDTAEYINRNPRFIFFQPYAPGDWPAGSLGVPVTEMRSLATDKSIFPRGGVIMAVTTIPSSGGNVMLPFNQLMMDQDTGGAIRAPGRADIFMGIGEGAEKRAGNQAAEGKLYYFFLKPEKLQ